MADRLTALQSLGAPGAAPLSPAEPTAGAPAVEAYTLDADAALAAFNAKALQVHDLNRHVVEETVRIQQLFQSKIQTADLKAQNELQQQISAAMDGVNATAQRAKDLLNSIQDEIRSLEASPEQQAANAGVLKIERNQYSYLLRGYTSAMEGYQSMHEHTKQSMFEEAKRRITIRYTNSDGTSIDDTKAAELATEVLELGAENSIFQQSRDTLQQLIENRNDILRIERSLRELNQLFTDLAVLINEQGEVLDQVMTNVQQSVKYVERGRKQLQSAKKIAKKSRKCICCVIAIVAIIALFIIVPVVALTVPIPNLSSVTVPKV